MQDKQHNNKQRKPLTKRWSPATHIYAYGNEDAFTIQHIFLPFIWLMRDVVTLTSLHCMVVVITRNLSGSIGRDAWEKKGASREREAGSKTLFSHIIRVGEDEYWTPSPN